jgi:hypothetical protein
MSDQRIATGRYFSIIDPTWVRAVMFPAGRQQRDGSAVELREISATGVVLLIAAPPKLQGAYQISLTSRKLREPLEFEVRIEWMQPNAGGVWQVGCVIQHPLDDHAFARLLSSGVLERRSTPREPARIPVEFQLSPTRPRIQALVRNISEGGLCCLTTSCPPESTREVCIFASPEDAEIRIPLKVRWSMPAGSEYFIGCQFVRSTDFAVLRRLQSLHTDTPCPGVSPTVPPVLHDAPGGAAAHA